MLQETLWGNDVDVVFLDIVFTDEAFDTAEVVNVGMSVDDSLDGSVSATVLLVECECSSAGLLRSEGVDDNDTLVALNDGCVGEVKPAHLVDRSGDMIQSIHASQLRLAPQTWVGRVWGVVLQEVVGIVVPHHIALSINDLVGVTETTSPAPFSVHKVLSVIEGQTLFDLLPLLDDV